MRGILEQQFERLRLANLAIGKPKDTFEDLTKNVDSWLWVPFEIFLKRRSSFIYRKKNLEKSRTRVRLAQRKSRERVRQEFINKQIRAVYWHEVYHPTRPIRQYKCY